MKNWPTILFAVIAGTLTGLSYINPTAAAIATPLISILGTLGVKAVHGMTPPNSLATVATTPPKGQA